MRSKYKNIRFFLFTHSYPGKSISAFMSQKYKSKKMPKVLKRFSDILDFNYKQLEQFVVSGIELQCPYKRIPKEQKVYLEIERELLKLKEEKSDKYSTAKEDYQRQLLYPAFERAAGNSLGKIKDDHEFSTRLSVRINEYGNIYYKVAYRYKLPTIRIVPFLLRLIS